MSETQQPSEGKHLVGSLTNPITTFQHTVETQRNAAMAHESLLVYQLTVLQSDLEDTRRMIDSCDSALETLSKGPVVTPETTEPPVKSTPPDYTSTLEQETPPPAIPPVPPFLTADRTAN